MQELTLILTHSQFCITTRVMVQISGNKIVLLLIIVMGCNPAPTDPFQSDVPLDHDAASHILLQKNKQPLTYVMIEHDVKMKDYFDFIDRMADEYIDSLVTFRDYILVNANPWIIDSLGNLNYYQQLKKGVFVYDQTQQVILHAGDSILIPDLALIDSLSIRLKSSRIDVNLPEFKLRIIQQQDTVLTCNIRIGQNKTKFLEYYQKEFDLRTPIGEGEIVTIRKNPKYIDLQTGEEYVETNRDDGRRTKMPIIPSLTPSINGRVSGTLIHATTNPKSLGKAYSHGCIGTSEPDIWSIFYYSPTGTRVTFRYDLEVKDEHGQIIRLRDIYHREAE